MTVQTRELVPETPYIWRAKQPGHTHRLICFPHAGAGAAAYADWVRWLPPEIELVAVQLPGRQNRIAEQSFTEVGPLVNALTHALRPVMDGSFSFFGHSCGAALAYELTTALRARGRRGPEQLFLSGRAAPDVTGIRQLHELSDEEFSNAVLELGGIDPEIAADEFVMSVLLEVLRADFGLWERHQMKSEEPLDCLITALGSDADPQAPLHSVRRWREHTNAQYSERIYAGGHFYFLEKAAEVVSFIGSKMLESARSGSAA
ncbi:thioesterase II family protein [Streptomyces alboflavus]|uniref:thioesterase II family protein n=1 Tax=Streptomyces alboflavus TaxID=67267 RepID=UPI0004BFD6E5|nr:thioesterase domain-containing protein [Streptomyces alboflavus]